MLGENHVGRVSDGKLMGTLEKEGEKAFSRSSIFGECCLLQSGFRCQNRGNGIEALDARRRRRRFHSHFRRRGKDEGGAFDGRNQPISLLPPPVMKDRVAK